MLSTSDGSFTPSSSLPSWARGFETRRFTGRIRNEIANVSRSYAVGWLEDNPGPLVVAKTASVNTTIACSDTPSVRDVVIVRG